MRGTVEDTLKARFDAEADRLCNAQRYERTGARHDTQPGHYERSLETKAREVTLNVPKLRRQTFETAIIERNRRREASVEATMIKMYLAGASVRKLEDITEALWGTRVSPTTVNDLNKRIYATIDTWRNRPIEDPARRDKAVQSPPQTAIELRDADPVGQQRAVAARSCGGRLAPHGSVARHA